MCIKKFLVNILKGKDNLVDLSKEWKIIIELVLRKQKWESTPFYPFNQRSGRWPGVQNTVIMNRWFSCATATIF